MAGEMKGQPPVGAPHTAHVFSLFLSPFVDPDQKVLDAGKVSPHIPHIGF